MLIIIGIDTNRVPIPKIVSKPPINSVYADKAALKCGHGMPQPAKRRRESIEIVELAPSRLHEEVSDEHSNQQLHYPFLSVQQVNSLFSPFSYQQRPACFTDSLCTFHGRPFVFGFRREERGHNRPRSRSIRV